MPQFVCPKCKKKHYSRYGVNYPAPVCTDCNQETTLEKPKEHFRSCNLNSFPAGCVCDCGVG